MFSSLSLWEPRGEGGDVMPALCSSQLAFMISCINIYQKPIKLTVLSYVVVMWLDKERLKSVCAVCTVVESYLTLLRGTSATACLEMSGCVCPSMHAPVKGTLKREMWLH